MITVIKRSILMVMVVGMAFAFLYASHQAQAQGPTNIDALIAKANSQGTVRIIVELNVPGYQTEGDLPDSRAADAQRAAIKSIQASVLTALSGQSVTAVTQYDFVPYLAMEVDAAALQILGRSPDVTGIEEDVPVPPALGATVPLIRANLAHSLFYRGNGQTVAIIDTGVDKTHSALSGKVVSEACYSTTFAPQGASSLCPGGASSSTASNSGLNCSTTISGCDHGTHVGGIAAGVAPEANLIAIQVFSRMTDSAGNTPCANVNRTSPCTLAYTSNIISGLERVFALRNTFDIASVNMSLGGGQFTSTCNTDTRKTIIDNLRSVGITTVIAAGNSGYTNAMGAPACISTAVSVASTTKSDQVASYSNLSSITTLFAPGSDIVAPVPGNIYDDKNGTSMAAPHVAGAVAILKQADPGATVNEIEAALTTNFSPLITDQRSGGSITKRRLDVYNSLCHLISCDSDDYRTIFINQSLNGTIGQSADRDHYYFNAIAGNRLTLQLNRSSGSMDPYLELYDPNGVRVAVNNNGGNGNNALINDYSLQRTGRYLIVARSVSGAGTYQLQASQQAVQTNPVPSVTWLSPRSATATPFGANFWMRVYGQNFIPQSQVYWNGSYRSTIYSSSTRLWARIRGSDIGFPAPRLAFVTVRNPEPGGGNSNPYPFSISFPFLGESELVAPPSPGSAQVGISATFAISWTHPVSSWHVMQNMDLRLRDEQNKTAAWIRLVEGQNMTSTFRLLNPAETSQGITDTNVIYEGLPGENRDLVLTDTVTLHLAQSTINGTGQTIIMTPTVTFGPAAVGTYNIEFRVDNDDGSIQDDDVLGTFTILPVGCDVSLANISLSGTMTGTVNTDYAYSAAISPTNATTPISYTWSPEPQSGQGTTGATYNWSTAGQTAVAVAAENCGSFVVDGQTVALSSSPNPDLEISKRGPAIALAGQPITYTLTVTNNGAATAANPTITDTLPPGASYVGGGSLGGNTITWNLPGLSGYGTVTETVLVVSASSDITNTGYGVSADGGYSALGSRSVRTQIVDAMVSISPTLTGTLSHGGDTEIVVPQGSVFARTEVAYRRLATTTYGLPAGAIFKGRAFRLDAYQSSQPVTGLAFSEAISVTLTGLSDTNGALYYWTGSQWSASGVSCNPAGANTLTCSIDAPVPTTQFALLEATQSIYLPMIIKNYPPAGNYAQITGISLNGSTYEVAFTTFNFTPVLPGQHVHFFFNTVPPDQAGVPGAGPWQIYGGSSPFTDYTTADKPAAATQLCVLVANPDHSVQQNTGNCYNLP